MSTFVESLKRLYGKKDISDIYLGDLLSDGKITQEEYDYITAT